MNATLMTPFRGSFMGTTKGPRYGKEEFARRGEAIFEAKIRAKVERLNPRHFLTIDIETGDYEVDANEMAACARLRSRVADAQIWLRKVGSKSARRFGGHRKATRS
jgi:hypothetical protein